ncbi:MAG TPA: alpha/beta hydrolase [Spirochaetes bacterium]|nr:alpha/beta hydrolase [Spirochaetota bacterium]
MVTAPYRTGVIFITAAFSFLLALSPASSCRGAVKTDLPPPADGMSTVFLPATAMDGAPAEVPVDIYSPPGVKKFAGDILVLPGWKFSRVRWHRETVLVQEARKRGFRLVFPDMMITLYESEYYPQTSGWVRWGPMPGGLWVREVLIPHMRKRGLFMDGGKNFLLGLSTGGRGVALVHLQNPGVFHGGAALSGDFDQSTMAGDKLMAAMYGPYQNHPHRWKTIDNPSAMVSRWSMPLYIGHGRKDNVVPLSQSKNFYEKLKTAHPGLKLVFSEPPAAGHDFRYWSSEVVPVLDFFLSLR